jgi:hypothetical protein
MATITINGSDLRVRTIKEKIAHLESFDFSGLDETTVDSLKHQIEVVKKYYKDAEDATMYYFAMYLHTGKKPY